MATRAGLQRTQSPRGTDTDVPQADNRKTVLAAVAADNIGILRANRVP